MRILLGLIALALATTAGATTTSTSSSTTTSTLAAGSAWTCTIDGKDITTSFYWSVGHCVSTGAYTTSGGDPLGSAATMAASAQALCGSGNSSLILVLTAQEPGGAIIPSTCGFDLSTFKYTCAQQATASASTAMVESTITAVVMSPFKFLAICK